MPKKDTKTHLSPHSLLSVNPTSPAPHQQFTKNTASLVSLGLWTLATEPKNGKLNNNQKRVDVCVHTGWTEGRVLAESLGEDRRKGECSFTHTISTWILYPCSTDSVHCQTPKRGILQETPHNRVSEMPWILWTLGLAKCLVSPGMNSNRTDTEQHDH